MNTKHRTIRNAKKEHSGSVSSNRRYVWSDSTRLSKSERDVLLACLVLKKAGLTSSAISKIQFPKSHHTIDAYCEKASEMLDAGNLYMSEGVNKNHIPKEEKDIEFIHFMNTSNPCGGGKKSKPIRYNDDWECEE